MSETHNSKRVGIVSCYFQKNYGSALQAYATQKIMDLLQISYETIDISGIKKAIRNRKMKHYMKQLLDVRVVFDKLAYVYLSIRKRIPGAISKGMQLRAIRFQEFQRLFHLGKAAQTFADLARDAEQRYDAVIVGSDQLWLPSNIDAGYYTLEWVPDTIRRISFSTSFGLDKLSNRYLDRCKQFLSRFHHISVREESGRRIIKQATGMEVPVICDPTLLISCEEWDELRPASPVVEGKYIFCYLLGKNLMSRNFAAELRKKTGLTIVAVLHSDIYVPSDNAWADQAMYDVGPGGFIDLIARAEHVCTDSFHATVFSMLYHKSFFVFRRFADDYSLSTNSRLDSILGRIGVSDRIFEKGRSMDEAFDTPIPYAKVDEALECMCREAKSYLTRALEVEVEHSDSN